MAQTAEGEEQNDYGEECIELDSRVRSEHRAHALQATRRSRGSVYCSPPRCVIFSQNKQSRSRSPSSCYALANAMAASTRGRIHPSWVA